MCVCVCCPSSVMSIKSSSKGGEVKYAGGWLLIQHFSAN